MTLAGELCLSLPRMLGIVKLGQRLREGPATAEERQAKSGKTRSLVVAARLSGGGLDDLPGARMEGGVGGGSRGIQSNSCAK